MNQYGPWLRVASPAKRTKKNFIRFAPKRGPATSDFHAPDGMTNRKDRAWKVPYDNNMARNDFGVCRDEANAEKSRAKVEAVGVMAKIIEDLVNIVLASDRR